MIIVLNRLRNIKNDRTRPNQTGFRPGMGCCDHIFSLGQILEHRLINHQETIQVFIDFVTAFDSVKGNTIWEVMKMMECRKKMSV